MVRSYRISMHRLGAYLVGMSDVLSLVDRTKLTWRITFITAVARQGSGRDVLELERRVRRSPRGAPFTRKEMAGLAHDLFQVVEAEMEGHPADGVDAAGVTVEARDSSEWLVHVDESRGLLDSVVLSRLGVDRVRSTGWADEPIPPIVTDDDGDIAFHARIEDAELDLEAVDARDGIYEVFDSVGHRLVVRTAGERVLIALDPDVEPDPDELSRRLRLYIEAVGPERVCVSDTGRASLPHLVDRLAAFFGLS